MQELQQYVPQPEMSVKSDLGLKDIAKIMRRRRRLFWGILAGFVAVFAALSFNPHHKWWADAELVLIQQVPAGPQVSQQSYAPPSVDEIGTPYDLIQTRQEAKRALDWYKNLYVERGKDPNKVPYNLSSILGSVRFSSQKGDNSIDISAYGYSAQDANDLANAVAQSFVAWNREIAQQGVVYAIDSLTPRVHAARAAMVAADNRLMRFEQSNRLADVPAQEKAAIDELALRDTALDDAQQEANAQNARLAALDRQLRSADLSIKNGTGVRDDTLVQSLQTQLSSLEIQRQQASLKYTPAYPGVLPDLDARIADIKRRLAAAVKATLNNKMPSLQNQDALITAYQQQQAVANSAQAALAKAQELRDQAKAQTMAFPKIQTQYELLSAEASERTAQYNALRTALNQALVNKNTIDGDIQMTSEVVNDPFNQGYYSELFILVGLFLGLVVAAIAVLIAEQLDTRLYTVEEVRRLIGGPIVGALPDLTRKEKNALRRRQVPAMVMEAFHIVRANVSLVMRHANHREIWRNQVVMVASAVPGEGKSLTASLLARSLVQSGKRVVLVDANLRRPVLQSYFHSDGQPGLAGVLTDQASVEDALAPTDIPGLMVMHSGITQNHPTDLVSMPRMQKLIEALRGKADAVIIDTPPCSLATDALFLAPYVDCILQVVGVGVADEMTLADVTQALQAAAPKTTTYFLNHVPRERKRVGKYYLYSLAMARNGLNGHSNGTNGSAKIADGVNIVLSSGEKGPQAHAAPAIPQKADLPHTNGQDEA